MKFHEWMDHTKAHLADARHRLVLHNSWGIFLAQDVFGTSFRRPSDNKEIPLRPVLEQHVIEDLGRIPTLEQCLAQVTLEPWMYRNAEQLSQKEINDDTTATNIDAQATRETERGSDGTR